MTTIEVKHWTSQYYIANQFSCQQILENFDILREIPLLNDTQLHDIKDNQLVRFRGMIQDMYDPEYYFKHYEIKDTKTGKSDVKYGMYTDMARCLPHEEICFESSKNENAERHTYVVISIPGLNDWAKESSANIQECDTHVMHNKNVGKRSLDDNDTEEMDCSEPVTKKEKISADNTARKTNEGHCTTQIQSILSEDHILNFPIPINDGKACIVKVYDGTVLKLNRVIEVIGFISLDPILSTINASEDEMNEIHTHNPPTSLVPRLHAVKIIDLTKSEIINVPEIISKAQLIRNDLHLILSQLLFGDYLAADYLICHLFSTVYMRQDHLCLGSFPLNITNFPASKFTTFPQEFYTFLILFVKKSHFFKVTLENLNELALIPKKDYECNRLTSGVLQLSDNTHLVIDETGLSTGELTVTGKQNYKALSDVLMFQTLSYDFKYYTIPYETDIPMLIFSDVKSFIPCPTRIVLNVDADSENLYSQVIEAARLYLMDENRLINIRQYLQALRNTKFVINEEITKAIQDDFVQMRSTNKNINADNLHTLMVFARLMSISYGKSTLDIECWKKTVQLEMERMNRLPQRG